MRKSHTDVFKLINQIMADQKWRSPERIFNEIARTGVQTCECRERNCIHPTILTVHDWIQETMKGGLELDLKERLNGKYVYWRYNEKLLRPGQRGLKTKDL
jgi:hypothetical protein